MYLWWCFWNHENLLYNGNYNTLLLYIVVQDPPRWFHTELIELLSLYNLMTPHTEPRLFDFSRILWNVEFDVGTWTRCLGSQIYLQPHIILEAKPFCTRSIHLKWWSTSETEHDLSKNWPRVDFWRLSCPLFDRVPPTLKIMSPYWLPSSICCSPHGFHGILHMISIMSPYANLHMLLMAISIWFQSCLHMLTSTWFSLHSPYGLNRVSICCSLHGLHDNLHIV